MKFLGGGAGDVVFDGGGLGVGGLGVVVRDVTGLGTRDGTLDAVCDLVAARLLPRLGVLGGFSGFGVLGKSPGNGLLLDPLLIYSSFFS